MLLSILAFLAGDLYLQTFSQLPKIAVVFLLLIISGVIYISWRNKYICYLCAFMLGFAWAAWYAHTVLSWTLPKELEDKPIFITGHIITLPNTQFIFSLETLNNSIISNKPRIRLNWHTNTPKLKVGDKWQLVVRLKRIHGIQSPGAFDYEAWALTNGLRATGNVVVNANNKRLDYSPYRYPIESIRQYLQDLITVNLPHTSTSHWLLALMLGERHNINQQEWQVLRNTGTNHLMAIGGLHIGIIAGFFYYLVAWCWRRMRLLMLCCPAQQAASIAALIIAWIYSALAGFSLPTERACIMLTLFILASLLRRDLNAWYPWGLALFCVIVLNPLSVLTESFWLSFGTIALIIYGNSCRLAPTGYWWQWGRAQWVIAIGLIPCSLILFQQTSLVAFIANSIAIPWLSILLLPVCFLSSILLNISPTLGGGLLWLADKSLMILWAILSWLATLPFAVWHQALPSYAMLVFLLVGILLLLQPIGLPGRWLGFIWCLPLLCYMPTQPAQGKVWLTLLDVGQGLAIVIRTKQHTLVYDTGAKFGVNADMGESVVLPYLRTQGQSSIDSLIISHGDNDHLGGAEALLAALPIKAIFTSVPEKIPLTNTQYCLAGTTWQWDGVIFSFLYPDRNNLYLHNDSSCVLLIKAGNERILLPGDIEQYAEKSLLTINQNHLSATILIAPHHGSKTSGLKEFIDAVNPQVVLYSTGYHNRYHLPNSAVVATYQEKGIQQLNTVDTGTLEIKSSSEIYLYRSQHKRYWMD